MVFFGEKDPSPFDGDGLGPNPSANGRFPYEAFRTTGAGVGLRFWTELDASQHAGQAGGQSKAHPLHLLFTVFTTKSSR